VKRLHLIPDVKLFLQGKPETDWGRVLHTCASGASKQESEGGLDRLDGGKEGGKSVGKSVKEGARVPRCIRHPGMLIIVGESA
jgi:hypothetical protein